MINKIQNFVLNPEVGLGLKKKMGIINNLLSLWVLVRICEFIYLFFSFTSISSTYTALYTYNILLIPFFLSHDNDPLHVAKQSGLEI